MELAQGSGVSKGLGAGLGDPTDTYGRRPAPRLIVWNSSYGPNVVITKHHVLTNASIAIRTSPDLLQRHVTMKVARMDYYKWQ